MPHSTPLIATLVAGLGLAFVFGTLANRFRLPPLVGYLIAGMLVGPNTPGFVADPRLAMELAEIGIILLMFGVGLHFSLGDLLSVRAIAIPGAILQISFATVLGAALAWALGWSAGTGLVFGLALSCASTVVMLRALQERRLLETERGRIAIGWLIVEDLAMVLVLVLLPALSEVLGGRAADGEPVPAGGFALWQAVGITLAKVAAFVVLMLVVGRRVIPWILHYVAHTGSRELFRLAVLAIALGVAFGAAHFFDVSLALGAFFAGMVMSESDLSHRAAEESLPLRDAFSVLFFVSVGMLFHPSTLMDSPAPMLAVLLIIVVGNPLAALAIVLVFRQPVGTALVIAASLAQIGEFSFILAELGVELGLLPGEGRDLVLAGAILSIVFNPFAFAVAGWLRPWLEARIHPGPHGEAGSAAAGPALQPGQTHVAAAASQDALEGTFEPTGLAGHTILVGYGRVGSLIGASLREAAEPFLVIEDSDKVVARLHAEGIETIAANAASAEAFAAANPGGAKRLILAIPNAFEAGQVVLRAKAANPAISIVARAHSDAEVEHLKSLGADIVIMGEREIARGMVELALADRFADAGGAPDAPQAA